MLALARAVVRSLRDRATSALTTAKFGLISSTSPFSRSSSYAIVSSDEQNVPAVEHLGQERIRLCPSSLKLPLVEDRVIDLPPQMVLQSPDGFVQLRQIHAAHD